MCTGLVYQCKSAIRSDRGATWRVMFEKMIGLFSPLLIFADTVAKGDFRTWIAGKQYIPQQKSPRKDKPVGVHQGMERV